MSKNRSPHPAYTLHLSSWAAISNCMHCTLMLVMSNWRHDKMFNCVLWWFCEVWSTALYG